MHDGSATPTTEKVACLSRYKTNRRVIGAFCSKSVKSVCLSPRLCDSDQAWFHVFF